MRERKPKLNDRIKHTEHGYDRVNEGKVVELLGAQFIYITDDGHHRHCNYNEDWRKI